MTESKEGEESKWKLERKWKSRPHFIWERLEMRGWRRPYCILEWWKIKASRSQKYTAEEEVTPSSSCSSVFSGRDRKIFCSTPFFLSLRISSLSPPANFPVVVFQQVTRSVSARPETPQGEWGEKPSLGKQTSLWLMRQNPFVSFL